MFRLNRKSQFAIFGGLALLMLVTRSPSLASIDMLHGASWAVFFAAGFYLSAAIALPALLALAFTIDAAALGWTGVSAYCFTPAYAMLLPAYASLWAAGRWYAGHHRLSPATLRPLAASLIAGTLVCELFSSGGFYWFSGQFEQPNLTGFLARESVYLPAYFATTVAWTAAIAAVHAILTGLRGGRASLADAG